MSSLTLPAIQQEALAIVDELGASKLTMRRLATRLGVEAPSLYHHVSNKAALVDQLAEALWAELEAAPDDGDWQERVRGRVAQWREVLERHPHAVGLVGARPSRADGMLADSEGIVAAMGEAGIPAERGEALLKALSVLILGEAEAADRGGDTAWAEAAVDAILAGAGEVGEAEEEAVEEEAVEEEAVEEAAAEEQAVEEEAVEEQAVEEAAAEEEAVEEEAVEEEAVEEAVEEEAAEEEPPAPAPEPEPAPKPASKPRPTPPQSRPTPPQRDQGRGRGGLLRGIARRVLGDD